MSQQQALEVLVQAVTVAQKRGAFNLDEAGVIANAVNVFVPAPAPVDDEPEESEDTEEVTLEEAE